MVEEMVTLTQAAITKLKTANCTQLRIGVIGGGCSGYQHVMEPVLAKLEQYANRPKKAA
jgi:Fe-S cluster assembly iron-binding protein IscA